MNAKPCAMIPTSDSKAFAGEERHDTIASGPGAPTVVLAERGLPGQLSRPPETLVRPNFLTPGDRIITISM